MDVLILARDFAQAVAESVSADQLGLINERNKARAVGVCHSHDFCDANQCMIDALAEQNEDLDTTDRAQAFCVAEAWDTARDALFDVATIDALIQAEK